MSAAPILNDPAMSGLLAMAPALACDWADLRRVADAVCKSGDDNQLSQFLLMLSRKYTDDQIEELVGRYRMGFAEIIWEGSSLLKNMREKATREGRAEGVAEGKAEGRAEGKAQGRTEGQLAEARRLLRAVLSRRFPGLESMSEIDRTADVGSLESLLVDQALRVTDAEAMERAILDAAAGR